jgi:2-amino-4-hydroxy-6-hydroxymethyldihydropteridine diphosphokinase
MTSPAIAYIALGANLGDRDANIRAALHSLERTPGVDVAAVSKLIENPAVGGPENSPPFLNAAAKLKTTLPPESLMARLLEIEAELGRQRREKWGPRTIDLDLLLYGDRVIQSQGLTVPHPRMGERLFVLAPLAQIAPDVVHPVTRQSMTQMLAALRRRSR